jgi:lipopolysaccharide transport system ATP-binding protein
LGQRLFGDNTYLSFLERPLHAQAGSRVIATFDFRMPLLSSGEFSFDAALATGTQVEHTQQCWVHDAVSLRVSNNSIHGLVGVPMTDIRVRIEATETTR